MKSPELRSTNFALKLIESGLYDWNPNTSTKRTHLPGSGILKLRGNYEDILGKAMRGLGIGKNEMAQRLGVGKLEIEAILNGDVDEDLIKSMALELRLDEEKLIRSARKEWSPLPVELSGLGQISSAYGDMLVNAYMVWDEVSRNAWVFDTGTDVLPIMAFLEKEKLKVDAIF